MDFSEIFVSAFEAIRINKVRSALTSLGIIIGVASVILLISLGTGLQKSITSQFERLGTNTLYVMPGNIGEGAGFAGGGGLQTNKLKFSDADLIERNVDNITSVSNGVESITSVEYRGEKRNGVIFLGVDAEFWATGAYKLDSGRFFSKAEDSSAKRVVVVGKTIVEKLFAGQDPLGKQLTVRGKRYQVIGVLEELGSVVGQDQDNIVIIPAETANLQIGFDRPTWILISAASSDAIPEIQSDVTELLGKRLADDEFSVLTSEESLDIAETILGVVQGVFVGIAAISLLVGGIGISNIMLVSVTERTREIGLRKAIGAKNSDILIQFLIEAVILSLTGGLIGLTLATAASFAVRVFIPATVTVEAVILAIGFSILVGTVFGVFPAFRASKLEPIEALRSE
ncbi:MAG TPA: ABC transporter permease [Patescibacteria group bacterium]|nr:ABC transporter permease [Patescibacteria group bacterium]